MADEGEYGDYYNEAGGEAEYEAAGFSGECRRCGQTGHMAKDCPNAGQDTCYRCGRPGHISRDCPNEASGEFMGECNLCGEKGHRASQCPNTVVEVPEERDPYAEAEARKQEADEKFGESAKSVINFEIYDNIPVEMSGQNLPKPIAAFSEADLPEAVMANVKRCKYNKPTPVQKYAIPIGLAGRDLMACAQTGSGKTAAFCFPMISKLLKEDYKPQKAGAYGSKATPVALIVSPTRELTCQIYDEARKFAYQTGIRPVVAYGGAPVVDQVRELERGCDILVATPGRLNDFVERGRVRLRDIKFLVLDEADRMLDMGFEPQIRKLIEESDLPATGHRQTLMFSATFPKEIQQLAADFLHDYVFLSIGRVGSSTDLIMQHVEQVAEHEKREVLVSLIHAIEGLTLVFVTTKRDADMLEDHLRENGYPATTIHGDRSQAERDQAMRNFRSGKTPILVATDVAARGLDIPHVTHVINYEMPQSIDDYVHRIGRTGRAGKRGLATAFYTDGRDDGIAHGLRELLQETNQEVPDWLTQAADMYGPSMGGGRGRGRGSFSSNRPSNRYGGRPQQGAILPTIGAIPGRKIVSWTGESIGALEGDFDMTDDRIVTTTPEALERMWRTLDMLSIIVRQFTDRRDEATGLPIKRVQGYVWMKGSDGLIKLTADEMQQMHEYQADTGEHLGSDPAVEYA
ncbi:hypothetical protein WJX72_004284 [[Myrmecia] bisecta]|uniref:RNA helicase n=1 Tax=[Myrmecia] bisecta TaxID=41462 RepID=A0AAW1R606_9CHLO